MLAELMVAGRGIATAAGAFGSTVSNRHSSHGTHNGGQAPAQHLPVQETALSGSPNELWVMLQHQVQQAPDLVLAASLVVLCSAPA